MNIHKSVRDYVAGQRIKANPVLRYTSTGFLVEAGRMNIHESVREYVRGERNKANPVLCYTEGTDTLTVESGLSPHDGQIVLCSVEFAGNPLLAYDPQDDADLERLALELIAESDRNELALEDIDY